MTASPTQQVSPNALEEIHADVVSQFTSMMASGAEGCQTLGREHSPDVEERTVLQQLSPVSKFLHSIQPNNVQFFESVNPGPSESEPHANASDQHNGEGCLAQDHTPSDTPKAKHFRPSPPKFTDDSAHGGCNGSQTHLPPVGNHAHIPRQLLQQLAAQQLRINELEQEVAAEKQKATSQTAQIQAQQKLEEALQKELNQLKAASVHAAQQAATLRQDLVIAHAARSEADCRAAATASELKQVKISLEESQSNILQQCAAASAVEADLQQQVQETNALQQRLDEADTRAKTAAEEVKNLQDSLKKATQTADTAAAREEEALQEQLEATEREASATARQAEWKKAAEAAAVLAEASIAEANTAKAAAASAQAELQAAKAATALEQPNLCASNCGEACEASSPRAGDPKCNTSPSPGHDSSAQSPVKEFRDTASAVRVLNKLQQRLYSRCCRSGDRIQGSYGMSAEAAGSPHQGKRKRSHHRAPRIGSAGSFNVVEALDDLLMHEKQLMKYQFEAAKANESQTAEALNQRVSVMEAEAAVLRAALVDAESACSGDAARLASEYAAASNPTDVRSTGTQVGLPHSLVSRSTGASDRRSELGTGVLSMSAYTQTEAEQSAKRQTAGTQTDDETLKNERLQMWDEMEKQRKGPVHSIAMATNSGACGGGNQELLNVLSGDSMHTRPEQGCRSAQSQPEVTPGAARNRCRTQDDVARVHGRHGRTAFVGDPDAADLGSSCAKHSPSQATKGLDDSQIDRWEVVRESVSSHRAAGHWQQHPKQRSCNRYSMDTESHNRQASREQRRNTPDHSFQYEESGQVFDDRAGNRVLHNRQKRSEPRRRCASVPPNRSTAEPNRAADMKKESMVIQFVDTGSSTVTSRVQSAAQSGVGPRNRGHRDRSLPSRSLHREAPAPCVHAAQDALLPGVDAHAHGWVSPTEDTRKHGHQLSAFGDTRSQGYHSRESSQHPSLSDSAAHATVKESYPAAFAPSHSPMHQPPLGNIAASLQYTLPSKCASDGVPELSSHHNPHAQPHKSRVARSEDEFSVVQCVPGHTHHRKHSEHNSQAGSSELDPKRTTEHKTDADAGVTRGNQQGGFDDGLRDLVARLDQIQRKQAAALAQMTDAHSPDAHGRGVSGECRLPLSPDIHSDGAWVLGQVGHGHRDGIPTPETLLGIDVSPDPVSLASIPKSLVNASQEEHRPGYAPSNRDIMLPSSDNDERFVHESAGIGHIGHGDHSWCRTGTSLAPPLTRISGEDQGSQRSSRSHNLFDASACEGARPLHHSTDLVGATYSNDIHDNLDSMHASLSARAHAHHIVERGAPHAYQRSTAATDAPVQPQRDYQSRNQAAEHGYASVKYPCAFQHDAPRSSGGSRALAPMGPGAASCSSHGAASAWRSRVRVSYNFQQTEQQHQSTPGMAVVRGKSPLRTPLSRSASILDAAARQCLDLHTGAQTRQSTTSSMSDVNSTYPANAFAASRSASSPPPPTPPRHSSLGTPDLRPFRSTVEGQSGHTQLVGTRTSSLSGSSRPTPRRWKNGHTAAQICTGSSVPDPGARYWTSSPQVPQNRELARRNGPPRYGALRSAKRISRDEGWLQQPLGPPHHGTQTSRTSTAEESGESHSETGTTQGGRWPGVMMRPSAVQPASIKRGHFSEGTWSRLRREHVGRRKLGTEVSSDSGSV